MKCTVPAALLSVFQKSRASGWSPDSSGILTVLWGCQVLSPSYKHPNSTQCFCDGSSCKTWRFVTGIKLCQTDKSTDEPWGISSNGQRRRDTPGISSAWRRKPDLYQGSGTEERLRKHSPGCAFSIFSIAVPPLPRTLCRQVLGVANIALNTCWSPGNLWGGLVILLWKVSTSQVREIWFWLKAEIHHPLNPNTVRQNLCNKSAKYLNVLKSILFDCASETSQAITSNFSLWQCYQI